MKKIKIKAKLSDSNGSKLATVELIGELVLKHAKYIQTELGNYAAKATSFKLVINNPEALDLSIIQMIYSLKKSLLQDQKTFNLQLMLSDEQKSILIHAGFKDLIEL